MGRPPLDRATLSALVTDVHIRGPFTAVRAFGRAGIPVVAVAPNRRAAGLWSRYASEAHVAPDAATDPAGFARRVVDLADRRRPIVIYPGTEASIDAMARGNLPAGVELPYPAPEILSSLRDKRRLDDLAQNVGLRTPRVFAAGPAGELIERDIPTPCVVKMPIPGEGKFLDPVARTGERLRTMLAETPRHHTVIVQELIEGPVTSLALVVARDGTVAACLQQVALRARPERVGITSLAISVPPDEDLVARAGRMLATAGYWGLAQLQFLDAARRPTLIDVNPRFYGTLSLAIASGVNLPAAWHAVASGDSSPAPRRYRAGVTYRFFENDLKSALEGAPGVLLRRAPAPRVGAAWACDDPVGGLFMTALGIAEPGWRVLARRLASIAGSDVAGVRTGAPAPVAGDGRND